MSEHPIVLVVEDDLERNRWTVLFRWLLALPHFVWLGLWSVIAFLAALISWVATLIRGQTPTGLHNFLAAYVRYATQVYGYAYLAANPYPSFDGKSSYPIDVSIGPPAPQRRSSVAFRAILALPAILFAAALVGSPSLGGSGGGGGSSYTLYFGVLHIAALFGWVVGILRARMPRGLRDAAAYALSYGAQLSAYMLLLTDRYPNSDPVAALKELPSRSDPVEMEVDDDLRRSRLTVFFRILLALPHFVWLTLWGIAVFFAAIANWLSTLVRGTSPRALHRFLAAYVRYVVHVYAFSSLLANPFPGFVGAEGSYPIDLGIAEQTRQNRWTVLFRLLLAIPAMLLASAYGSLLYAVAFLGWFVSLFTGRMPLGLRNAGALALRYMAQTNAYVLLVSGAYPYSGPTSPASEQPEPAVAGLPSASSPTGSLDLPQP